MHSHTFKMVILSKGIINEFITREPRATETLLLWYRLTKKAEWFKFQDTKKPLIQPIQSAMTVLFLTLKAIITD